MIARRWPVLTLVLIAANIAAAFALLLDPDLATKFGFQPDHPHVYHAFTSLFLHANVLHLLGNMVFLAAVGAAVELATGSFRFAVVYLLSGLVGVLAHYLMTRNLMEPAPYIGASGAIAGCAAYYTIRYTSLKVPVAPHRAISVLTVTGLWVVLQAAGAFIKIGDTAGTAYWSHLGGFLTGIVLTFVFRAPDLGQLELGHEVLDRMNARGPAAVMFAAQEHLKKHPSDPKALNELADAYEMMNEPAKQADVLVKLLDVTPSEEVDLMRRLSQIGFVSRVPIIRRLQIADRCKADAPFVAKALYRSVAEGPDDIQRPEAMFAWASLERAEDAVKSDEILMRLQQEYPLHPTLEVARKRGWLR